jgi:hypothetical protein
MTNIAASAIVIGALLLAALGVHGCASARQVTGDAPATSRYGVEIGNAGKSEITDASVHLGSSFRSVGGVLVPGVYKSHDFVPVAVPKEAKVVWTSADGRAREVAVSLEDVPSSLEGYIVFAIDPEKGSVAVTTKPYPGRHRGRHRGG